MIRCYLLHLEALLLKPPGDLVDIILRNAEARRVLLWSQEPMILRGVRIMLLRDKLIERRLLRRIRLQQQDHMLHREIPVHRRYGLGMCQSGMYVP